MKDLGEEARVLIELGRAADEPTAADRARVRTALAAQLGAAAGLGVAAGMGVSTGLGLSAKAAATASAGGVAGAVAGASTTAAAVAGGSVLATKLIGAALLVAAGFGGGAATVHLHHTRHATVAAAAVVAVPPAKNAPAGRHAPAAMASPEAVASPDRDQGEGAAARPQDTGPPAAATSSIPMQQRAAPMSARACIPAGAATRARILERRASVAIAATEASSREAPPPAEQPGRAAPMTTPPPLPEGPSPSDGPAARRSRPDLAEETRMVRDGVAALRAGDPARALGSFDAHAIAYPQGVLTEERAAERALALAELGRPAAACAEVEAFLREHPTSPLAVRLRKRLRALDVPCDGSPAGRPRP